MAPKISLEMAQCAREKLQASAHEIWSSIRSFDDIGKKASQDESGAAPKSPEGTTSLSMEKVNEILKIMFGSCTTGAPYRSSAVVTDHLPPTAPFQMYSSSLRSSEFLNGEHVYEQLFMDDEMRASRAVDGLRERAALSPPDRSQSRTHNIDPAPASNLPPGHNVPVAPPTTKAVDVSTDFDFDDGVSAISAHTLEEMALVYDHQATTPSHKWRSSNPGVVEAISHPLSSRSRSGANLSHQNSPAPPIMSPIKFSRGLSHGTHGSKATKSSKSTKSTNSTHESEFASVWRKEERKYWDNMVEQDKKSFVMGGPAKQNQKSRRRRSRCGSLSTKDVTVTTVGSSSYSNFSSQFDKQHPHHVIHFNTRDNVRNSTSFDPGRIQQCLDMPYDSELGEI